MVTSPLAVARLPFGAETTTVTLHLSPLVVAAAGSVAPDTTACEARLVHVQLAVRSAASTMFRLALTLSSVRGVAGATTIDIPQVLSPPVHAPARQRSVRVQACASSQVLPVVGSETHAPVFGSQYA